MTAMTLALTEPRKRTWNFELANRTCELGTCEPGTVFFDVQTFDL
jgi:hypothetical protein